MMNLTKEQHQIIKLFANLGKSVTETLIMIRQAFGEESMSQVFERHALIQGRLKKARQAKSKFKSMLIIFLTSRHQQRICPGKPNSQFFILL
jgi:hypothetical protein